MSIEEILDALRRGQWLHAGAADFPEISALLAECADRCHELNLMRPSDVEARDRLLRKILGSAGDRLVINSPFRCDFGFNIHVGDNFIGNFNLAILDEAEVRIGRNVQIGPNCTLITITHALDAKQRNEGVMCARLQCHSASRGGNRVGEHHWRRQRRHALDTLRRLGRRFALPCAPPRHRRRPRGSDPIEKVKYGHRHVTFH